MPTVNDLFVEETAQPMAVGEAKVFTIDFGDIGAPSAVNSVTAYDATGTDKSADTLSGSNSISGNSAVLKKFTPASAQTYRLVCSVTIDGNTVFGAIDIKVISLTPATGITNGYTTRAKVLDLLRAFTSDVPDDALIDDMITQVSRLIDHETGRRFYASTETHYLSVPDPADRLLMLDDDLISVTTLTNGDTTVITTSDYYLLPKNVSPKYAIVLKESSNYVWECDSSANSEYVISLAGSWGYSSTTPADIEMACRMICEAVYRNRFGQNVGGTSPVITAGGLVVTPQDVPVTAMHVIHKYTRFV